jgi:LysM repeat protein
MTTFRSRIAGALLLLGTAVAPLSTAVTQAAKPSTYTVKAGDTLMSIARELFGDANRWRDIFEHNSDQISDPKRIYPGLVLKVSAAARPTAPAPAQPRAPEIQTPQPQPERPPVVIEEPQAQEPASDSLFARRRGIDATTALRTYREQPYRPLRRGEFYSAGFLTEGGELPFGRVLGAVTPQQIRNLTSGANVTIHTTIAVLPPGGSRYQVGDSLLLVQRFTGPPGYGEIVYPTGLARVTGLNGDQALATVLAVYGAIRNGQSALPAERFAEGGTSRAQPVENGVTGKVLGQKETRELKQPQNVLFIDLGRKDGVARGDVFEVRRDPAPRPGASDTIDELMAVLQIVHVRERSATAKVLNVISPDIPPGTRVKQVGKLPS